MMNERIRKLADEAAKFSAILALPTGESGDKLFVEKFAELIVQKCAKICVKEARQIGGRVCADKIKQHFGVEL